MKYYRLSLSLILVALGIMACNLTRVVNKIEAPLPTEITQSAAGTLPLETVPAPTSTPVNADLACLVNTWEATGLSDYIIAAVPPEMAEEYDLQYKGSSGSAYFTLTRDGRILMQADGLELQFTAKSSIFTVPVTVSIDGQASGNYSADDNILTTSNMDTSELTASAEAMGQTLLEPAQIINAMPLINPAYSRAQYNCAGETLTLKLTNYPDSVPPLVFKAVK